MESCAVRRFATCAKLEKSQELTRFPMPLRENMYFRAGEMNHLICGTDDGGGWRAVLLAALIMFFCAASARAAEPPPMLFQSLPGTNAARNDATAPKPKSTAAREKAVAVDFGYLDPKSAKAAAVLSVELFD